MYPFSFKSTDSYDLIFRLGGFGIPWPGFIMIHDFCIKQIKHYWVGVLAPRNNGRGMAL